MEDKQGKPDECLMIKSIGDETTAPIKDIEVPSAKTVQVKRLDSEFFAPMVTEARPSV